MKRFLFLLPFLLLGLLPGGAHDWAVEDLDQEGRVLSWDPYRMVGILREGERRVVFRPNLPWALGDYRYPLSADIWVDDQGQVWLSEATALLFRRYLEGTLRKRAPLIAAVIIDPGHGGRDPGAVGQYTTLGGETRQCFEKDITLQIAKDLGGMLTADYPNRKILFTREDDRYLSLKERTKIANEIELEEHEAMIFISIHVNASFNTQARGFEVWYLPPEYRRDLLTNRDMEEVGPDVLPILNTMREEEFTQESISLAKAIINGLDEQIGGETPNRGLKEESWFVVRKARMPSVLVEAGFISHSEEAAQLHDPGHLKKMALGIYNGVRSFLEEFEQTKGFTE